MVMGGGYSERNEDELALLDFLKDVTWENPFAVTFTMAVNAWRDASQNFRHFINRLNQLFLGSAYRRFGKRLRVLPVLEGNQIISPHYHCVIDNPFPQRNADFIKSVRHAWWKTELRKPEIHIEPMKDDGWIDYILKRRSKPSVLDSVDWQNVNI